MKGKEILGIIRYLEKGLRRKSRRRKTSYEPQKAAFSDRAHKAARQLVYPKVFNVPYDELIFRNATFSRDVKEAIDREIWVPHGYNQGELSFPYLRFTVQERFRRLEFMKYKDITLTEWNRNSGYPSELYKLTALLFLYGYFEEERKGDEMVAIALHHPVVINTEIMLQGIQGKKLPFTRQLNPKNQWFIGIKYKDLLNYGGAVHFYAEKIDRFAEAERKSYDG